MDNQTNCKARAKSAARIALGLASIFPIQPDPSDHKDLLEFIAEIAAKSVDLMPDRPEMVGWRDNFFQIDFSIGQWIGARYKAHGAIPDSAETCQIFSAVVAEEFIPY
ncbi:hypothetical protein POK33_39720 [Burkholderia cenocepacia]|uniref:hypothetical protein n=1 Tax=Burkholderia cenocepacia TaxID=95486 RepID=UPI0023BA1E55|nr:hypothetical protein [Burkholderia cenocepacia]MDF0506883.1 hypothetical protein [Burkholderia cenocepacia]